MRTTSVTCDECGAPAERGFKMELRRYSLFCIYDKGYAHTRDLCEDCGEAVIEQLGLPKNHRGLVREAARKRGAGVRHEADFHLDLDTNDYVVTCTCGWVDGEQYPRALMASEAAQAHLDAEHPREPTDVEIYGAGA